MQKQSLSSKALLRLRSEICNDLIVDYVINHLVETEVLTPEERDVILKSGDHIGSADDLLVRDQVLRKQTENFVDLMIEKVNKIDFAFSALTFILFKDDNYPWIVKELLFFIEEEKKSEEMSQQLNAIEVKAEKSVIVCYDLPNKVRNLLNRTDKLDEIRTDLNGFAEKNNGWLIISGMGGSGKTILAAEALRDWNGGHYSDGIWWTNCGLMSNKDNKFDESMLLLKMQFLWEKICDQFCQKFTKLECLENAVFKLKSHFKSHRKSLIVLDDVWNKEVLENFELGIPILVTTRDRSLIPYKFSDVKYHQTIDDKEYGLSVEESRELLALWVKCEPKLLNTEYVNRLIEKLKGNPLCLTLIGNVMEEKGNEVKYWKYYFESIENSSENSSPVRRRASSGNRNNFVYDSLGFDTLVKHSFTALDQQLRDKYKYFALFLDDLRIPIEVFQTVWGLDECGVEIIMDKLVKKSLVMILKTNNFTLYMVHDIILNFLKTQYIHELESLHSQLLDRYFELCQTDEGIDYSLLPKDGYIYYFLGYHIYKANKFDLFPDIFLDLSFVVNKIRYTGPSDLLNDYFNYKEHFKRSSDKYRDFVRFVSTNADLLCDLNIDVLQLALCQSNDSEVYKNGLDLVEKSNKIYLKWCNQSNVKTSKLLSTKMHSGAVSFAVFDPKNDIVVSVGTDKLVKFWDSNTGKQLRTMKGHQNTINCCEFSSDGTVLITASDDGTVKIWNLDSDDLYFRHLELSSPRPRSGSEYPYICNGSAIIDDSSATYEGHLNPNESEDQTEVKCCALSPDNSLVVSGGTDRCLHVWSISDLTVKHILKGHEFAVNSCQFSSNSESIISSSGDIVRVWSASKGTVMMSLKHEMCVANCVFGAKLNYIYASSGRYVYQWSSSDKSQTEPKRRYNNLKTKYYCTHCTVSPNGQYIAAGTTTEQIVIWGSKSYPTVAVATFKCADKINCINFNKDSTKLLSCCDDGTVIIWDTSKAFGASMVALRKKFSVQNHKTEIKVLTPDENGTIRLFEGIEGKENRTLAMRPKSSSGGDLQSFDSYDITSCALAYNLDILFGTSDGELILHRNSTKETHFLESHEKEVTFCAFIGINKFVSASKDSSFRIFKRHSLSYERPKCEVQIGPNGTPVEQDIEMGPIVNCKTFSRDNKAMIWCENGLLFVIDLKKDFLIACCEQEMQINCADITANEELIATVSSNNMILLWRSIFERNEIFKIRCFKSRSCPRSCRFAPNAEFLTIGHDNGTIKVWNFNGTESKQLQKFHNGHSGWVNDIAISPNGNLIITISKSIKLWDRDGKLLQTFKTNGGSMSSIYANFVEEQECDSNKFSKIVTVDDAGVLYILQILNFRE